MNQDFFEEIKRFFGDEGLSIAREEQREDEWSLSTALVGIEEGPKEKISVTFKTKLDYLFFNIRLAYPVQSVKSSQILKILNRLNYLQTNGCFFLNESTSTVDLSCGFFLNGCERDAGIFARTFGSLQNLAETYFPSIHAYLNGKKNESEVYDLIQTITAGVITYENQKQQTWN
jgi:hypothetical protein